MMYMEQALVSNFKGNSWICLGCSWGSCHGLFADPVLSDVVHASYNTHATVWYHIHICIIILGPLHHWWGTWFKFLSPKTRVRAEYVWGIVGGHAMVCLLIQSRQMWSMPHVTVMQQCDSISIPASSSFRHYTTDDDEVHGSSSCVPKPG